MTRTLPTALPDAAEVADRAGVRLLALDTLGAVQDAAALLARVWRATASPLSAEVIRAVEHSGGYAFGAYREDELVGTSAGFLGLTGREPVLHSHISGTAEAGRGVGLALKLHQRAWCLERGVRRISWTFDPLVRRNAWFNLAKLGAVGVEYLVDFYGPMTDGVNAGEATDRLYTVWELEAPTPGVRPADGTLVLDAPGSAGPPDAAGPLLVRLPADVEALRTTDRAAAGRWRTAVREAVVPALADGRRVTGITADGCLVLR